MIPLLIRQIRETLSYNSSSLSPAITNYIVKCLGSMIRRNSSSYFVITFFPFSLLTCPLSTGHRTVQYLSANNVPLCPVCFKEIFPSVMYGNQECSLVSSVMIRNVPLHHLWHIGMFPVSCLSLLNVYPYMFIMNVPLYPVCIKGKFPVLCVYLEWFSVSCVLIRNNV